MKITIGNAEVGKKVTFNEFRYNKGITSIFCIDHALDIHAMNAYACLPIKDTNKAS